MWSSVYRQTGKAGGGRKARGLDATRTSGNARLGPPRPQNRDTPEIATKSVDQPRFSTYVNTGRFETAIALLVGLFIRTVPNRTSHPSGGLRQGLHPLKNLA